MRQIVFSLLLILSFGTTSAQNILTLEESIKIAMGESYSIKAAQFSLEGSKKNLEAVKLGLRSSVDLEFDLPNYSRSLTSEFNTATGSEQFFKFGSTKYESRLSINQPIIYTNGTISIFGSLFKRDQFSEITGDSRDFYSNLGIRLRQPLFVFNSQMANLERAEINLEKSERNYTQAEREIIYNVTVGFFSLYQAKKNVEIAEEKVKQNEISYETASNKFKAGLIAEVEALQLEVDLASSRNELLNAQSSYQETNNNFKLLIGINLDESIDVVAQLDYKPVEINLNKAIENALQIRSELLNAQSDIYLAELNVDEVDSRTAIKAELNANYGINKNDDEFNKVFNEFADTRSVTFTVSVPVFDWGKNAREVEAAEADYSLRLLDVENLKETIKNEIITSVNRVNSAKARVDVLSKTVEVAEKSYSITLERFKAGTITSFDLSQMQLRLTDARQSSLNALVDYKVALADLEKKSFLKFE
ncbi:MAG: TolC family protein [bacterium]